jgi:hypothetical protein
MNYREVLTVFSSAEENNTGACPITKLEFGNALLSPDKDVEYRACQSAGTANVGV